MSTNTAVLYIRAVPRGGDPEAATQDAIAEGRAYAAEHGMEIVREIVDEFADDAPDDRPGWQELMDMVRRRAMTHVIVRWPNSISITADVRYAATGKIKGHGIDVIYAWKPQVTA